MEQKVAGTFFNEKEERVDAVVNFTVDSETVDGKLEVSISTNEGDIMVCLSKEDFDRIADKIKGYQA